MLGPSVPKSWAGLDWVRVKARFPRQSSHTTCAVPSFDCLSNALKKKPHFFALIVWQSLGSLFYIKKRNMRKNWALTVLYKRKGNFKKILIKDIMCSGWVEWLKPRRLRQVGRVWMWARSPTSCAAWSRYVTSGAGATQQEQASSQGCWENWMEYREPKTGKNKSEPKCHHHHCYCLTGCRHGLP